MIRGWVPTVAVRALLPVIGVARHRRAALVPGLWSGLGLDPGIASRPDERVPATALLSLFERVGAALEDPLLGLHIGAEGGNLRRLDLLPFLAAHSATIREAVHRTSRYLRLLNEALELSLHEGRDDAELRFVPTSAVVKAHPEGLRHLYLVATATAASLFRQVLGPGVRLRWIAFASSRPAGGGEGKVEAEVEQFFGCRVRWGSPRTAIGFDPAALEARPRQSDPELGRILLRHAEEFLARLPRASARWSDRVHGALLSDFDAGRTAGQVARALGTSTRSLQRRLKQEGTTYARVNDEVRRDLALRYVSATELGMAEIAFLLHFNDVSAFYRAFRRWTGATPAQARASASAGAPGSNSGARGQ